MREVPAVDCPFCGALLDAAMSMKEPDGEYLPKEGAITVCLYCARPLVFGEDLRPRRPTAEEYSEIMQIPLVRRAVSLVKAKGPRDPGRRRPEEWKEANDGD